MADVYGLGSTVELIAQAAAAAGTGEISKVSTSASLAAQAATAEGVGEVSRVSTSAGLVAQAATAEGAGDLAHVSTSADLVAQAASVSASAGSGNTVIHELGSTVELRAQSAVLTVEMGTVIEDVGSTATLIAQSALMSGVGSFAKQGTGALVAQRAAVASTDVVERKGTGALSAQAATFLGGSERVITSLNGNLIAQAATASSAGTRFVVGTGALISGGAGVEETGLLARVGSGSLLAIAADADGVGGHIDSNGYPVGSGDLVAQAAQMGSGSAVLRIGTGALVAESAELAGSSQRVILVAGNLLAGSATTFSGRESEDQVSWEADDAIWGQPSIVHAKDLPVMIQDDDFFQADIGRLFGVEDVFVVLERVGLTLIGRDRQGNWKVDPGIIKFVSGVWPLFRGVPGTEIKIYVGSQMNPEDPITWEGPYTAVIGETDFLDYTVSGRYLALRFESTAQDPWELVSYDLDLTTVGGR